MLSSGPPRTQHPLSATHRNIAVAFVVAAGASIAIGLTSFISVSSMRMDADWVAHTEEVIGALQTVLSTVIDAEASSRGYAISGNEVFLQPFRAAERDIDIEIARLRRMTADNEGQQKRLGVLAGLLQQRMARCVDVIAARHELGSAAAREVVEAGASRELHDAIRDVVAQMTNTERALLTERKSMTDASARTATAVILSGNILTLGVALAALALARRDFAGSRRAQMELEARVAERTAELTRANERLNKTSEELRLLVEQAPLAIAMFDRNMRYIATSRRWVGEYGRGRNSLETLSHYEINPDMPSWWTDIHRRGLAGEFIKKDADLWVQADGSKRWLNWAVSPWRDARGDIGGITILSEDITPRRLAEERLRLAEAVFMSTQEGIAITDLSGVILAVNPALSTITEYSEEELVGQHVRLLHSDRHDSEFYRAMGGYLLATGHWQGETWNRRKTGEVFQQWMSVSTVNDEGGNPAHYVAVVTDTSRMHFAESHLQYVAHHDALTGLPNRSLLYLRLGHTIARARRDGTLCAVLFLDLDGFKAVNDTLGHKAGDEVLRLAADRMRQRLRENDTLARVGGDEFVAVLEQLAAPWEAGVVAQTLIEQLRTPFHLGGDGQVNVGASAGISLCPADGTVVDVLIRRADAALYRAKAAGRGTWRFYCTEEAQVE